MFSSSNSAILLLRDSINLSFEFSLNVCFLVIIFNFRFFDKIEVKQSSAQITDCYELSNLIGKQVLGVVNFPSMSVAGFKSEVIVVEVYSEQDFVLIEPQQKVKRRSIGINSCHIYLWLI